MPTWLGLGLGFGLGLGLGFGLGLGLGLGFTKGDVRVDTWDGVVDVGHNDPGSSRLLSLR